MAHITSESNGFWYVDASETSMGGVATCYYQNAKANARLIAASPDLLEAIADLIEIERRDNLTDPDVAATDGHRERTWDKARSALAKAQGKDAMAQQWGGIPLLDSK